MATAVMVLLWIPSAFAADGAPGSTTRDPMQPPAISTTPAVAASRGVRDPAQLGTTPWPRHLMVIDGRRWVIERGQRLGVGDKLGDARIERIGDGVVWLRDARGLREMSFYAGVSKRTVAERDEAAHPPARTSGPATTERTRPAARRRVAAAVAPLPSEPRTP
jgi:hypothetical protein